MIFDDIHVHLFNSSEFYKGNWYRHYILEKINKWIEEDIELLTRFKSDKDTIVLANGETLSVKDIRSKIQKVYYTNPFGDVYNATHSLFELCLSLWNEVYNRLENNTLNDYDAEFEEIAKKATKEEIIEAKKDLK